MKLSAKVILAMSSVTSLFGDNLNLEEYFAEKDSGHCMCPLGIDTIKFDL